MQHIIQVAFDYDDATIAKRVEDSAYKDILERLVGKAEKSLPSTYGKVDWRIMVDSKVREMLEDHKDEIIKAAVGQIAESVRRSKKFREAMEDEGL